MPDGPWGGPILEDAMSGKTPHAAFCEEYDEDAHVSLPETRRVANVAAKRSKTDLRVFEPLIDGASDSGYSSRTAATVNSAQSVPSGCRSSVPLRVDTALAKGDVGPVRSTSRRDRVKDKSGGSSSSGARPARDDKMHVGTHPSASHMPHARSSSKARRRESAHVRHYPGTCWECDQGLYHQSTPIEPPQMADYAYYSAASTPIHDYPPAPPSPQTSRYPLTAIQDIHVSHSSRPHARASRSNSYHTTRPMSYHGGVMPNMAGMVYSVHPTMDPSHYDQGMPLHASAFPSTPSYAPTYGPQSHYPEMPEYIPQAPRPAPQRERSDSSSRDRRRSRRSSMYGGQALMDYEPPTPSDYGGEPLERRASREQRPRMLPANTYERDEDYYLMPPPPLKSKQSAPPPQIIQKRPELTRKSATTAFVPKERRASRTFDMADVEAALPDYRYRRMSRDAIMPERSHSTREGRRTTSYHDVAPRPARMAMESAHRRRMSVYDHHDQPYNPDDDRRRRRPEVMDDKQREAEEYQAARGKPVALTADALRKVKTSHRADSDSASVSLKSRSSSSRGSHLALGASASASASKAAEDDDDHEPIVMTMNGVTMSFTQESAAGKRISVRTGQAGQVEFNIEGKRPKRYLAAAPTATATRSDHTTTSSSSRRELEDAVRSSRPGEDPRIGWEERERRSDRASRRSSRSTYSNRGFSD